MDNAKLDKIIELLEAIRANQEANQYHYYPPVYYYPPYSNEPPYPQPDWTYPADRYTTTKNDIKDQIIYQS